MNFELLENVVMPGWPRSCGLKLQAPNLPLSVPGVWQPWLQWLVWLVKPLVAQSSSASTTSRVIDLQRLDVESENALSNQKDEYLLPVKT